MRFIIGPALCGFWPRFRSNIMFLRCFAQLFSSLLLFFYHALFAPDLNCQGGSMMKKEGEKNGEAPHVWGTKAEERNSDLIDFPSFLFFLQIFSIKSRFNFNLIYAVTPAGVLDVIFIELNLKVLLL